MFGGLEPRLPGFPGISPLWPDTPRRKPYDGLHERVCRFVSRIGQPRDSGRFLTPLVMKQEKREVS